MKHIILHGWKRDGILHTSTVCECPKMAEQAAKVYCVNTVHDCEDPERVSSSHNAWKHMLKTGRVAPVVLECRVREVKL